MHIRPALERWQNAETAAARAKKDQAPDRYALRSAECRARRALVRWRRDVARFTEELAAVSAPATSPLLPPDAPPRP